MLDTHAQPKKGKARNGTRQPRPTHSGWCDVGSRVAVGESADAQLSHSYSAISLVARHMCFHIRAILHSTNDVVIGK